MIEEILPSNVVAEEVRNGLLDAVLFPEEEKVLGQSVDKRRREFTTARACARQAFARLDLPPMPVLTGSHGEPQWPPGVVGSITHCKGYCACAIAHEMEIVTLGIDAEPNEALPKNVLTDIAFNEELVWLRELMHSAPGVCWDRLIYSAKEAVYKAWFPLTKRWLGFEDAAVTIDRAQCTFSVRLLVPGPLLADRQLTCFTGKWTVRNELILTAIALPSPEISARATT